MKQVMKALALFLTAVFLMGLCGCRDTRHDDRYYEDGYRDRGDAPRYYRHRDGDRRDRHDRDGDRRYRRDDRDRDDRYHDSRYHDRNRYPYEGDSES